MTAGPRRWHWLPRRASQTCSARPRAPASRAPLLSARVSVSPFLPRSFARRLLPPSPPRGPHSPRAQGPLRRTPPERPPRTPTFPGVAPSAPRPPQSHWDWHSAGGAEGGPTSPSRPLPAGLSAKAVDSPLKWSTLPSPGLLGGGRMLSDREWGGRGRSPRAAAGPYSISPRSAAWQGQRARSSECPGVGVERHPPNRGTSVRSGSNSPGEQGKYAGHRRTEGSEWEAGERPRDTHTLTFYTVHSCTCCHLEQ